MYRLQLLTPEGWPYEVIFSVLAWTKIKESRMHSVESFKFPFNYKILCFFTVFRILSCSKIVFTKFLTKLFQNTMNTKFCEIWRSNGSEYAEGCLTAFQWCLLVLSSGRWEIRARWIGFIYVFQLDKVKPLPSPDLHPLLRLLRPRFYQSGWSTWLKPISHRPDCGGSNDLWNVGKLYHTTRQYNPEDSHFRTPPWKPQNPTSAWQ